MAGFSNLVDLGSGFTLDDKTGVIYSQTLSPATSVVLTNVPVSTLCLRQTPVEVWIKTDVADLAWSRVYPSGLAENSFGIVQTQGGTLASDSPGATVSILGSGIASTSILGGAVQLYVPAPNTFSTITGDTGTVTAVGAQSLKFAGSGGVATSVSGNVVTIGYSPPNYAQWVEFRGDVGNTVANNSADILSILGGSGIGTSIVADALTITNKRPGFSTIVTDSGSISVNSDNQSISFLGSGSVSTSVSGSVITITGTGGGGGVTAHSALTGLSNDDHPQYGAVAQNEQVSGQWTFAQGILVGTPDGSIPGTRLAVSAGNFSVNGDAQTTEHVLRGVSTTNTLVDLTSDGAAAVASNVLVLPANTVWAFDIQLVGKSVSGSDTLSYRYRGVIRRDTLASSTTLDVQAYEAFCQSNPAWVTTVSANTTLGSLRIQAQGGGSQTVRWLAHVALIQVRS